MARPSDPPTVILALVVVVVLVLVLCLRLARRSGGAASSRFSGATPLSAVACGSGDGGGVVRGAGTEALPALCAGTETGLRYPEGALKQVFWARDPRSGDTERENMHRRGGTPFLGRPSCHSPDCNLAG
jgi:hypothetical protein